jgi:hypothetical protein
LLSNYETIFSKILFKKNKNFLKFNSFSKANKINNDKTTKSYFLNDDISFNDSNSNQIYDGNLSQYNNNSHNNYMMSSDDENYSEEDEIRMWNLEEKLNNERYNSQFLINLDPKSD